MKAYASPTRLWSCDGKSPFASFKAAARAARRARAVHDENLQPYRCRLCDQYHVGTMMAAEAKDYKRRKRALKEEAY